MSSMLPLMLVPLVVWVAVWANLWRLDARAKELQRQIARDEDDFDSV